MIILDDWQREVLDYKDSFLLCTGRRVGKTFIMAAKAIEEMAHNPGTEIIVVSLTEDQAQLIIAMALSYASERYASLIGKGKFKPTQNKIYFNKGIMQARPVGQTGDAVRGFKGDILIVDEASRMPALMWIAARPILLTASKARIWLCSTPFGKQGYFWEKFDEAYNKKDPNARFKVFYTTTEKVMQERPISVSWTEEQRDNALKTLREERKDMSEIEYGQEYLGLFLEDLRQFFPEELIERVCTLKRETALGKTYLGCDLARLGGDELSFEVIDKLGDKFYHRENIVKTKLVTPETVKIIRNLAHIWKCKKVGIDAGAGTIGVSILDYLLISDIKHKVVALNNREISLDSDDEDTQRLLKEDMYYNLLSMFEQGVIKLLDDDEIKLSLRSVQMEILETKSGKSRVRIFGNYTHITEGIIRAAWLAYKDKSLDLWIR